MKELDTGEDSLLPMYTDVFSGCIQDGSGYAPGLVRSLLKDIINFGMVIFIAKINFVFPFKSVL